MLGKFALCWLPLLGACVPADYEQEASLPELSSEVFYREIEPVLIEHCAFVACHGSADRPFRVFALHRRRKGSGSGAGRLTQEEHQANFDSARAFARDGQGNALLERKPLATSAGGYFHMGSEIFAGQDSFESTEHPGYQAIAAWARTALTTEADCAATDSCP